MDFEGLSKPQLILLTILVNFVTSVATGILTVSLLDHAPPYVTQTVNRVVEHSIETVAPVAAVAAPAPSNQELVTNAIGADAARIVAIYIASAGTSSPAVAIGTFLPKSRAVVTAAQTALPSEALITFADGTVLPASLSKVGDGLAIYGFADDAKPPRVPALTLVPASSLHLGQTALAIGADGAAATGIVSRVTDTSIQTTLPDLGAGSAVVDLAGNMIGLAEGGTPGLLFSADAVGALLASTTASITSSP
jgi:hypothetical protein